MPPVFHQGTCAFSYTPQVKELVYAMKFKHRPGLCRFAGKWMATQLEKRHGDTLFDGVQRILPVPLHPTMLKQRGYNQSWALAQGLLESWPGWRGEAPLILDDVLEKRGDGLHQRELGKLERQKNAENIFHVKNPEKIQGLHVLLVDDVRTTGATANACATLLIKAGASRVDVTVFAGVES
jgi:ComF family protein